MTVRVTIHDGMLAIDTPFSREFKDELKDIVPSIERKWDDKMRVWLVHPKHGKAVKKLIRKYYLVDIQIPDVKLEDGKINTDIIKLLYLGTVKDRNKGFAYGLDFETTNWDILIHKDVLETWFNGNLRKVEGPKSLFQVLGVSMDSTPDEIKKGFRKMALQWHPDHCKEPNAADKFRIINDAYNILKDEKMRERYLYGINQTALTFGNVRVNNQGIERDTDSYVPNLRCGILNAKYEITMGRRIVQEIYSWDDIVDANGKILVTSWAYGDTRLSIEWVDPNMYGWY